MCIFLFCIFCLVRRKGSKDRVPLLAAGGECRMGVVVSTYETKFIFFNKYIFFRFLSIPKSYSCNTNYNNSLVLYSFSIFLKCIFWYQFDHTSFLSIYNNNNLSSYPTYKSSIVIWSYLSSCMWTYCGFVVKLFLRNVFDVKSSVSKHNNRPSSLPLWTWIDFHLSTHQNSTQKKLSWTTKHFLAPWSTFSGCFWSLWWPRQMRIFLSRRATGTRSS